MVRLALFAALGVVVPSAAWAQEIPSTPPAFVELVACIQVADPALRLVCFDEKAARFEAATKSGDLVITDRASRKKARKGLFGFDFADLNPFDNDDEDEADEIKTMDDTIVSVGQFGFERWRIELANGSVWIQTDDRPPPRAPAVGNPVHIYRGPLGGFMMKIDNRRAIKVRRVK